MERTLELTNSGVPSHSIDVEIKCGCKSMSWPPPSAGDIVSRQELVFNSGRKRSKRESSRKISPSVPLAITLFIVSASLSQRRLKKVVIGTPAFFAYSTIERVSS